MGASLALAGFNACTRQPAEKIVPYVRQPEEIIPGRPLFFATAMTLGGVAHRPAGREPRRAPDENRRQSAAPGQPWRRGRVRAGGGPRPVRSRPRADADESRRDSPLVGVPRRGPRRRSPRSSRSKAPAFASSPNRSARRRSPHRSATSSRAFRRRNGISGIRRAAKTPAPARSSPSASTSERSTTSIKADVILSLDADFLSLRSGQPALRARFRRAAAARRCRAYEPPVRDRDDADARPARAPITVSACKRARGSCRATARGSHRWACRSGRTSRSGRRRAREIPGRCRQRLAGASRRDRSSSRATANRRRFTRSPTR